MSTSVAFVVSAILVAVIVPFAIEETLSPYPPILLIGLVPTVLIFTAAVGLPIYAALPARHKNALPTLLAAAFATAFVSFAAFNLVPRPTFSQIGPTVIVENGSYTPAGLRILVRHCLFVGATGAVGGFVFWLMKRLTIGWSGRER